MIMSYSASVTFLLLNKTEQVQQVFISTMSYSKITFRKVLLAKVAS